MHAAWGAWHAGYSSGLLKGQHHLVNRRRGNAEVATHVGFGWRLFEDAAVGVDEARYWPWICVRRGIAVAACGSSEGLILGFICVSTLKEVSMNIKFHIELSQSERDQLAALLRGDATHRARSSAPRYWSRRRKASATR